MIEGPLLQLLHDTPLTDVERVIELAVEVPLTADQLALCSAIGEPAHAFKAERDALFAEAWRAAPATTDTTRDERASVRKLKELTESPHPVEMILEVIGWRMSAARLPKLQALAAQRRNPN